MTTTRDREDEVRRLLTLAAEDVPADLDLLAGFRARRGRRRRPRLRILVAAGTVAAAAAAAITVTLTAGPAPARIPARPARTELVRAAAVTAAQNYRISARITGNQGSPRAATITGAYNTARGVGEEQLGAVHAVYSGSYLFWSIPAKARKVYEQTYHHVLRPEQTWIRVTVPLRDRGAAPGFEADLGGVSLTSTQQLNPQHLLALVGSATQVHVTGRASGAGWTGTRYAYSARFTQRPRTRTTLDQSVSGTVDVDQQDRVRGLTVTQAAWGPDLRLRYQARIIQSITVTFSGFGQPVPVTIPSASQVFVPAQH
jgi:hypothetical protein